MNYVEIILKDEEGIIFHVGSDSSNFTHTGSYDYLDGWWCSCEHYNYRRCFCKHMQRARDCAEKEGIVLDDNVFLGLDDAEKEELEVGSYGG